jgi:rubredoxin
MKTVEVAPAQITGLYQVEWDCPECGRHNNIDYNIPEVQGAVVVCLNCAGIFRLEVSDERRSVNAGDSVK